MGIFDSPVDRGIGYGLPGGPRDPVQMPGGILGGYQQPSDWASKLGLFSAALKDASAQFSGQQDQGALPAWLQNQQQTQVRQQLMGALASQDPAVRQQGYTAAAMLGIPTDAIQKQQAAQQLPQLLASMKPSQQTFNSQSAPLPGGGNITTAPINFEAPGLNIQDAIAQAPPELQGMYAPKLLDQQMAAEAEAQKPVMMSPGQHRIVNGVDTFSLPEKATPNQPFNPDGSPNPAFQKYEQGKIAAGQAPQWARLAFDKQKTDLNLGGPATQPLESYPPQVQSMVKAMIEGRQAPPSSFALSKPYWQNMLALANQADPTFDQTAWGARASARKDMLGGGKSYQLLNSGNTAIQHLGRLHDQIGDVSGVQVPLVGNLINSGINMAEQASGVPGVNAYNDTLGHLSEETTKFYRGTGGAESDVARNMSNLAGNLSTAQKQAGVANTVHLIYGALQPKVEQYNKTMGTNYPVSHFLSAKSAQVVKNMGFDPDTGEALAKPQAAAPSSSALPRLPSAAKVRVYNPTTGRLE